MDPLVIRNLIYILILCIVFLILVFFYVQFHYSLKNEKRIKEFALDTKNKEVNSVTDHVVSFFYKIISKISKRLSKHDIFNNYSKRFSRFLIYNRDNGIEDIDYISFKFIIMILFQLLYIFVVIITANRFNIFVFILVSIFAFFVMDIGIIIFYQTKKKQMEEQLLQAIIIMNSAFKSGKNISQAIDIVKDELESPINEEFEIVAKDLSYGLSLYEAFTRFYNRVKIEEAKYITSSLSLLSKTGGNIVTVFNMIEKNFYDRLRIKNELDALTATSKLLYRFLLVIPIIFIFLIVILNPSYFNALITTKVGWLADFIMLFIYLMYFVLIKKLMKVDEVWNKVHY